MATNRLDLRLGRHQGRIWLVDLGSVSVITTQVRNRIREAPDFAKTIQRIQCSVIKQGYRHVPMLREALQRELKIKRAAPTKVAQHQRGSHSELQLTLGLIHARQFKYMVQKQTT